MFWIEGLSSVPNGFALKTLHKDGVRTQETLAELGARPFNGKTSRTRITTDFESWSAGPAQPFWEFLGINMFEPYDGHHIFRVKHEETEFLIPACVVMAAMIRPIKHVHPFLFRPHGLDQMSVPLLDSSCPRVGFFLPVHRVTGNSRVATNTLLASYSWMHCFPSARRMWESVFQAAHAGRLEISLPRASITTVLRSVAWGAIQLVNDMVVTTLSVNEDAFEFAAIHPLEIAFHAMASIDGVYKCQTKTDLTHRNGAWSLSDEEWDKLRPTLQRKLSTKHDLRRIIDLILVKLGTATAWHKLDFQGLDFSIVQATYRHMQQDGRWAALEGFLNASRAAQGPT